MDVKLNAVRRYYICIEDDRMRLLRMQITCPRSTAAITFLPLFFSSLLSFFSLLDQIIRGQVDQLRAPMASATVKSS